MIRSILQPSQDGGASYRFPRQSDPVRLLSVYAEYAAGAATTKLSLAFEYAGIAPIADIAIPVPDPDNVVMWTRSIDTSAIAGTIGYHRAPLPDIPINDKVTVTLQALDPTAGDSFGLCHWVFDDLKRE